MRRPAAALIALLALALPAAGASAATRFYIKGAGFGHGIGMSQHGAYGFALHGYDYKRILAHYYSHTGLGHADPARTVRVLLAAGSVPSFSGATHAGSHRLSPSTTYSVRASGSRLVVTAANGRRAGVFGSPLTVAGTGPLRLAGVGLYRGALVFHATGGGVETVNALDLEDYVRGVVSAEMPASWSMAALEAQAVAARTYAITTGRAGDFDQYADTRSQMYTGVAAETARTDAAIRATRGVVVTYGGRPAVTYFFDSSGGRTENIEYSFVGSAPEPWLKSVADPYDGVDHNRFEHWSFRMTMGAAAAELSGLVKGSFRGIRVVKRGRSPRVVYAEVLGSRGRTRVSGPTLRARFGLYDTWAYFTVISSTARPKPAPSGGSGGGAPATIASLPDLELTGVVDSAPRGARIAVQELTARGWHTIERVRAGSGGSYRAALMWSGTYRVLYGGLVGPSVVTR